MNLTFDKIDSIETMKIHDFILIRSAHIGTLPINGNHSDDLMDISEGLLELIATKDESISEDIKFYDKNSSVEYKKYIEDVYNALIKKDPDSGKIASALIIFHSFNCNADVPSIRIWKYIEDAWGDKSRNNCTYLSVDRIEKEYIYEFKKEGIVVLTVLVIHIDC